MAIKDQIEKKRLLHLNISIVCIFVILTAGGYWFGRVDFGKATLLGCIVVAVNFFVLQRLVAKIIEQKSIPFVWMLIYFCKLVLAGIVLFIAVTKLHMNQVGLMLGLSSIFFAGVVSAFFRSPASYTEDEEI